MVCCCYLRFTAWRPLLDVHKNVAKRSHSLEIWSKQKLRQRSSHILPPLSSHKVCKGLPGLMLSCFATRHCATAPQARTEKKKIPTHVRPAPLHAIPLRPLGWRGHLIHQSFRTSQFDAPWFHPFLALGALTAVAQTPCDLPSNAPGVTRESGRAHGSFSTEDIERPSFSCQSGWSMTD